MIRRIATLIILFVALVVIGCTRQVNMDKSDFEKSIIQDAEAKYPGADIIEIEGTEKIGEYEITNVRVTFNSKSVCPVRMRLRYKYPTFGYETGVPTYIVKDCKYSCEGDCIITGEEEAIVAAHSLPGTKEVSRFIGNGEDVTANAEYIGQDDVWSVTFTKGNETMNVNITAKNPRVKSIG
ncbi:MAG: hypothetical protein ACP5H8_00460 [Candidatus Micrarchaeia archaeon]